MLGIKAQETNQKPEKTYQKPEKLQKNCKPSKPPNKGRNYKTTTAIDEDSEKETDGEPKTLVNRQDAAKNTEKMQKNPKINKIKNKNSKTATKKSVLVM